MLEMRFNQMRLFIRMRNRFSEASDLIHLRLGIFKRQVRNTKVQQQQQKLGNGLRGIDRANMQILLVRVKSYLHFFSSIPSSYILIIIALISLSSN